MILSCLLVAVLWSPCPPPALDTPFLRWHWFVDDARLAIDGYDPVAYHTEGKAVKGKEDVEVVHGGIRYRFAAQEHADLFVADPEPYLPAYGGWCAYGLGQDPELTGFARVRFPADPELFLVEDGHLLLFARGPGWDGRALWRRGDPAVFKQRADEFWESREALAREIGEKPPGLHPRAPLETAQFDFFIGTWDSDYRIRVSPSSEAETRLRGRWSARYGWHGYAIYDDWVQVDAAPNTSGPAIRSFDPKNRKWVMHYIPINGPLSSVWRMTGEFDKKGELHGELELVDAAGQRFLQRIHFRDIRPERFTWSCDRSYDGGETWHEDWGVGTNTRIE